MDKEELIAALRAMHKGGVDEQDPQTNHELADDLLLQYIGDLDVREAFDWIEKWYS